MWHLGFRGYVHLFDHCVQGGGIFGHPQFGSLRSNFVLVQDVTPVRATKWVRWSRVASSARTARRLSSGLSPSFPRSDSALASGTAPAALRPGATVFVTSGIPPRQGQDNACSLGLHHPPDQLAPTVDPHSALQLISSTPSPPRRMQTAATPATLVHSLEWWVSLHQTMQAGATST